MVVKVLILRHAESFHIFELDFNLLDLVERKDLGNELRELYRTIISFRHRETLEGQKMLNS